ESAQGWSFGGGNPAMLPNSSYDSTSSLEEKVASYMKMGQETTVNYIAGLGPDATDELRSKFLGMGPEKSLAEKVLIAPGSGKPDAAFWSALIKERYNVMTCIEKDACVLVEQDLNSDGRAERILFAFDDERYIVYGFDPDKKEWQELTMSLLPRDITKEKLLTAAKDGKLGTKPKAWRDLVVDGERLDVNLNE
ncbi:MAG: hypothetical protein PUB78_20240, partial [Escherichia coli]|nr:hypothetical protein [Escherichia coli]